MQNSAVSVALIVVSAVLVLCDQMSWWIIGIHQGDVKPAAKP